MTKVVVTAKSEAEVKYLRATCGVRYWEDATVNGKEDTDGTLIPLRDGDTWKVTINLATGIIEGWPEGTTAEIHYKVCDEGIYELLDAERNVVMQHDGYVINMMCPEGRGYGDYVIMNIDGDGRIDNWLVDTRDIEEAQ